MATTNFFTPIMFCHRRIPTATNTGCGRLFFVGPTIHFVCPTLHATSKKKAGENKKPSHVTLSLSTMDETEDGDITVQTTESTMTEEAGEDNVIHHHHLHIHLHVHPQESSKAATAKPQPTFSIPLQVKRGLGMALALIVVVFAVNPQLAKSVVNAFSHLKSLLDVLLSTGKLVESGLVWLLPKM